MVKFSSTNVIVPDESVILPFASFKFPIKTFPLESSLKSLLSWIDVPECILNTLESESSIPIINPVVAPCWNSIVTSPPPSVLFNLYPAAVITPSVVSSSLFFKKLSLTSISIEFKPFVICISEPDVNVLASGPFVPPISSFPFSVNAFVSTLPVPFPINTLFAGKLVNPVPPNETGTIPAVISWFDRVR